jgi:thymidine phosphorylase
MLITAGIERDEEKAEARIRAALDSGAALERFRRIIERQGGDPTVVDDYSRLPSAPDRHPIPAPRTGYVTALQAEQIGRAAVSLGAGRATLDDVVDPGVGIEVRCPSGSRAREGEPVLMVHHRGGRGLADAVALLTSAVQIGDAPPTLGPLIVERIGQVAAS